MMRLLFLVLYLLGAIPIVWFLLKYRPKPAINSVALYLRSYSGMLLFYYLRAIVGNLRGDVPRRVLEAIVITVLFDIFQWWLLALFLKEQRGARK